jgi:ketosteroid isomerase-like protein
MADDIIFMVPGQEPFGKEAWSGMMSDARVEGQSDIQEIMVLGEWAWMRQHLSVTVTPPKGEPLVLSATRWPFCAKELTENGCSRAMQIW